MSESDASQVAQIKAFKPTEQVLHRHASQLPHFRQSFFLAGIDPVEQKEHRDAMLIVGR